MKKHIIVAPEAGKVAGPYSQAVVVGDWIFVSAEKGVDPKTGNIVSGGVRAQLAQAFRNVDAILRAAESSLEDVVRCVIYLADSEDFEGLNEVYGAVFPTAPPARSTVIVAELPLQLMVMVEVTAIRGCSASETVA